MKQPSKVSFRELNYQRREKNKMMAEVDYARGKGTITAVQHTRLQTQILLEHKQIEKDLIIITK